MKPLPNGCYRSDIAVTPANWNARGASTAKPWRIYYRFYDPTVTGPNGRPKPMLVQVKAGINHFNDLADRREAVREAIRVINHQLEELGFNPITNQYALSEPPGEYEIDPNTPFIRALRLSLERLRVEARTRRDIGYCIDALEKCARQLRYADLSIRQVARKHIKNMLLHMPKLSKRWSAATHNRYRAYLMMLFRELVELEAVTGNPVHDVRREKSDQKLRSVLTPAQRKAVDAHLQQVAPRFHQFVHLFFHSGGRPVELAGLRGEDVDLHRQVYRTWIKKGGRKRQVERAIKTVALPYWRLFMEGCRPDQYIFGVGSRWHPPLHPGSKPVHPDMFGRLWAKYVKAQPDAGGLGIAVDLYSLKHLNATETAAVLGDEAAAVQMGHTSTGMLQKHYDVFREDRERERAKQFSNTFA